GATAGAVIGMLRMSRAGSPYSGWQKLHHWLGLFCGIFILTFIFSGWLSMDDGLLFSMGQADANDRAALAGAPAWNDAALDPDGSASTSAKEVEWFAFGGKIYRRDRFDPVHQRLTVADSSRGASATEFLNGSDIDAAAARLHRPCEAAARVPSGDAYANAPSSTGAPVYRVVCGADWYDIDASDGAILQKLDASRRAYRWLFGGLHRLDFPILTARPALRTALIVVLGGFGFVFSITAVVIAARRLLSVAESGNS